MFIRAYLRASVEQDAERARAAGAGFAAEHGNQMLSFYVENESGATLDLGRTTAIPCGIVMTLCW